VKLAAYLAVIGHTLIAGFTFLLAKDATSRFTALQLAWFRITASGVLAGLVAVAGLHRRPAPSRRDLPRFALLGLLGVAVNQTLFLLGLSLSTPLHSALLYAFTPVLVLGGAVVYLRERVTLGKGAGILLALSGVVLVLSAQGLSLAHGTLRGDLVTLVAVFAWAAYTVAGKPLLARYDALTLTAWVFGFGALLVLPLAPLVLRGFDPSTPGLRGWSELAYLSVMTSGVAFTLWYFALTRLEASQLAVFNNLQAPLTALLAWLFLGAVPEHEAILGGVLVLAGVTVVQLAGRPPAIRR